MSRCAFCGAAAGHDGSLCPSLESVSENAGFNLESRYLEVIAELEELSPGAGRQARDHTLAAWRRGEIRALDVVPRLERSLAALKQARKPDAVVDFDSPFCWRCGGAYTGLGTVTAVCHACMSWRFEAAQSEGFNALRFSGVLTTAPEACASRRGEHGWFRVPKIPVDLCHVPGAAYWHCSGCDSLLLIAETELPSVGRIELRAIVERELDELDAPEHSDRPALTEEDLDELGAEWRARAELVDSIRRALWPDIARIRSLHHDHEELVALALASEAAHIVWHDAGEGRAASWKDVATAAWETSVRTHRKDLH